MKRISVIGYGRIGQAIKFYLEQFPNQFQVMAWDSDLASGISPQYMIGHHYPDGTPTFDYRDPIRMADAVIAATPYHQNLTIAMECLRQGKPYFDLTEDVTVTEAIRQTLNSPEWIGKQAWVSMQCGLAPGAIGMLGQYLSNWFDEIDTVKLRVGALPRHATNRMQYHLTWSTEGLINEYSHPCPVLVDGVPMLAQPLSGIETITIDGRRYEAFNTSGGIGSLIHMLKFRHPEIKNIDYKTIRYPGHCELMKFLLHDLRMDRNQETFVKLFNKEVPRTHDDIVILYVQASGKKDGQFVTRTYTKTIYGDEKFTAIQKTTAHGICAVVYYWAQLDELYAYPIRNGWIPCESIGRTELTAVNNPFWQTFEAAVHNPLDPFSI